MRSGHPPTKSAVFRCSVDTVPIQYMVASGKGTQIFRHSLRFQYIRYATGPRDSAFGIKISEVML